MNRHMVGPTDEGGAPFQAAIGLLRGRDQVVRRLDRAVAVDHDDLRVVRGAGQAHHVLDLDRHFLLQDLEDVRLGNRHDRVAVAVPPVNILKRRRTAAATLADHHHVLFEHTAGAQHHHARRYIGAAAGAGVSHHIDGLGRELVFVRQRAESAQRQRTYARTRADQERTTGNTSFKVLSHNFLPGCARHCFKAVRAV
jgi:hypothetical protein